MAHTILITGANRGIGLELVSQYADAGWKVIACCRYPDKAKELTALGQSNNISIYQLDVSSQTQIDQLASTLAKTPIDILFNNAGIYGQVDATFGNTNTQQWLDCFHVNTISPMKMVEAFSSNVANSQLKIIAAMSSKMGSVSDNHSGGSYVYRSSKAALNAVMKSLSIDLKPRNIRVAILHPGWVLTDMGGPNAEITVAESVRSIRKLLDDLSLNNSGEFFDIDGSRIGW